MDCFSLVKKPIDAVVVGLEMPGMSGIELARVAKAQYPTLPVILLSPAGQAIQRNLPEFINHFIPKPNNCELVSTVRRCTNLDKAA
jgi:CheY-like chemotaxis protein